MTLRFGLHAPIHGSFDYSAFHAFSVLADNLGYEVITVGDHFYLPPQSYGRIGGTPEKPDKLDAWTSLAAVAQNTEHMTLCTRVSPIPFYLPARLAKMVTTVDIISQGRTALGIGAGWFRDEAVSYGIRWQPYHTRLAMMCEGVDAILSLWASHPTASYDGDHYQLHQAPFWPKPIQQPHPPLWFGGSSQAIITATVKYGKGLFPLTNTPLTQLQELDTQLKTEQQKQRRTSNVILAPALSYPSGLGKQPSQWGKTIESHLTLDVPLILIDFTQAAISIQEAKRVLHEFAENIFPSYT